MNHGRACRRLRITVDGRAYDVTVEVLDEEERGNGVAPHNEPHAGGGNGRHADTITAPIAGTVQKVFVQVGGHVEAKSPVLLLDAMKMDTYIYAPRAGTIAAVDVHAGDAVRVGQRLLSFEPEA